MVLIPGIHVPFDTDDMIAFLTQRSLTTKSLDQILTKLKKLGEVCGHELHNCRFQQPSLQYQRLRTAVANLRLTLKRAGLDRVSNQAIAVGNFAISLLLSVFQIFDIDGFSVLEALHREFLTILVIQHLGCIRFGLFRYTTVKRGDLSFHTQDSAYALRSVWKKIPEKVTPVHDPFPLPTTPVTTTSFTRTRFSP